MIINRSDEIKRINSIKKWILLYGRRKTGKTFLVNNFIKYDEYFFIKSNKNVLDKNNVSITYETFIELLKRSLGESKTVVVDEFQRLGEDFFDFLHATKKQGKLILISSTLFLATKLISDKSPLLGLFAEIPLGLIRIKDSLRVLENYRGSKKEKLECAILLKEPLAIDYLDTAQKPREILSQIIISSLKTIPSLVGEVFLEEERTPSGVYDGILRAIATGKVVSGEISSYVFSKKLIPKDNPSIIQQYLNNLISFGLIKRIEIVNKKRFVYKLISPLVRMYYYADEKYNISERNVTEKEISPIIDEIMPRIVEDIVRESLAEKYGLRESIMEAKDFDIDGCLLKFNKIEVALEVKWKSIDKKDILQSENNLMKINAPLKIIFVPDKKGISSSLKVMDVSDLSE